MQVAQKLIHRLALCGATGNGRHFGPEAALVCLLHDNLDLHTILPVDRRKIGAHACNAKAELQLYRTAAGLSLVQMILRSFPRKREGGGEYAEFTARVCEFTRAGGVRAAGTRPKSWRCARRAQGRCRSAVVRRRRARAARGS